MPRLSLVVIGGMLLLAGSALAFEVRGVVKQVRADEGTLVVTAKNQDRTIRVPEDVKVFDPDGKPLAEGFKSKELHEGVEITLSVQREGDRNVLQSIRLGSKPASPAETTPSSAPANTTTSGEVKRVDTSALVPLVDLGTQTYLGFAGGLYPDGKNARPAEHEAAGLKLAAEIEPLDVDGKPSPDGKIVLLGIGFSNTVQAFKGFMEVAGEDAGLNPRLVLVNGALGGMSAQRIQNPDDAGVGTKYWAHVDERLKQAGVTRKQVQAVWIKETDASPHEGGFPKYVQTLEAELTKIVQILLARFPNLKLTYLSSRTYGGWAKPKPSGAPPGNSEPFSYESGFAYKWLIERQLAGNAELNYDPNKGTVKAPWLSWAAYLWTNGPTPRSDGVFFELNDYMESDRMHESPAGQRKVGGLLLKFFKTDPTTKTWFVRS